jgi:hypothetical protein
MGNRSGFIEYPDGTDKLVEQLKEELETHFESETVEGREAILAEIIQAYRVYHMTAANKPEAKSDALRECDSMSKAAIKMLKTLESLQDPIATHYDMWMHSNGEHPSLQAALDNHIKALYWTERQLGTEPKSKPQQKAQAKRAFKNKIEYIFETHNLESETENFKDNQGSFVTDTLETFDLI